MEMSKMLFMGINYPEWMIECLRSQYDVINLQEIWNSDSDEAIKEDKYRKLMDEADVLFNFHTGLFFWSKASYAKLKNKFVVTCWDGDDLDKVQKHFNGYLGHQMIDLHISLSDEIRQGLDKLGINSVMIDIENLRGEQWIQEFQRTMFKKSKTTNNL